MHVIAMFYDIQHTCNSTDNSRLRFVLFLFISLLLYHNKPLSLYSATRPGQTNFDVVFINLKLRINNSAVRT